ncbi:pyruvate formate lyase activating enzyme 1 [uncultured Alphaproteobacteria bacterium]|uniref:Pyruvate formate-lyase-activating enzyme n=1 Tax=uncultured Alphaproteobacteria bacterium TaxID=91750 RepID=A0A212IZ00_9PROT|nr:pyruvate formate lyase activating enzyme 1 [uncultured Alphaproteobacteria bacterium]
MSETQPPHTAPPSAPQPGAEAGFLHSVETGAAVDGPGMRFVYFLSGCMFRCLYCHNPDTWRIGGGRRVSLAEAVAEIAPYARFLRRAGGVTVSGGEPMVQAAFVGALLRKIKARFGLHTALDTQGFLHANMPDDWFDPVDLVLLDIKQIDPAKHRALTGKDAGPSLDCARRLARLGKPMWLRYVLVPGWSDDAADVSALADFLANEVGPTLERVEILPLHHLGAFKWKELGLPYALENTPPPAPELIRATREIFAARGIVAI